jgi:hypothetical protein
MAPNKSRFKIKFDAFDQVLNDENEVYWKQALKRWIAAAKKNETIFLEVDLSGWNEGTNRMKNKTIRLLHRLYYFGSLLSNVLCAYLQLCIGLTIPIFISVHFVLHIQRSMWHFFFDLSIKIRRIS